MADHLTPELLAFIRRWLPTAPASVLEVGCGDGTLTRLLAREGYEALGLDPEGPDEAGFVRSTLEEFGWSSRFDAAVAIRSLHHLHDPDAALDNLFRLLRPGGRLVLFEFAIENVDPAAQRWLAAHALRAPVEERHRAEVMPLADLRLALESRFRLIAEEPEAYLARQADRGDLVAAERRALAEGTLRAAGMRLAFERLGDLRP